MLPTMSNLEVLIVAGHDTPDLCTTDNSILLSSVAKP